MLWIRRDSDGDGRLKLGLRCSACKASGSYGAAQPLGDLERLVVSRVGQQDGELFSAEARRNISSSKVLLEHASDAAKDVVAGQVAVGVVDLAEEIEVREEDRQGRLHSLRLLQLSLGRELEVPGVEQTRLRIPHRLVLEQRNREPLSKQ